MDYLLNVSALCGREKTEIRRLAQKNKIFTRTAGAWLPLIDKKLSCGGQASAAGKELLARIFLAELELKVFGFVLFPNTSIAKFLFDFVIRKKYHHFVCVCYFLKKTKNSPAPIQPWLQ
jgi:hypothetical protein